MIIVFPRISYLVWLVFVIPTLREAIILFIFCFLIMVRKKQSPTSKTNIHVPPGKVILINMNKSSTPLKKSTPIRSPASESFKKSHNKSSTLLPKRKKNQSLRAFREIQKYQKSTQLLIPMAPFSRLVREITQKISGKMDMRFTELSLRALQEATEMAIVNLLEIANLCSAHAKRVTLTPADIRLTRRAFGLASALNP